MKLITSVSLCTVWLLAPAALAAQTATSAPRDTADTKADPAPLPAGFKLTGFAEGSYAYSGRSVGDTAIVGRLYDRLQNRFMLNALAVVLDKPYDAARFSAGFHAELLVGQDATVIQSNGFNLGAQADVPHLYVTRSEEHTSELQSPCNLVCRLLLEKKKKYNRSRSHISSDIYK